MRKCYFAKTFSYTVTPCSTVVEPVSLNHDDYGIGLYCSEVGSFHFRDFRLYIYRYNEIERNDTRAADLALTSRFTLLMFDNSHLTLSDTDCKRNYASPFSQINSSLLIRDGDIKKIFREKFILILKFKINFFYLSCSICQVDLL